MAKTWKVIKKTLLFTVIVLVVLSISAGLLAWIYKDDIKALAVKEVNQYLNAKVIISGSDIDITFFSTFPDAAIEFRNFKILEPGSNTAVLAEAQRLDFKFSPLDFINKQYHITHILLQDAKVNLKVSENGDVNYNILKPDSGRKDTSKAGPLDIKLRRIRLKNVYLSYNDQQEKRNLALQINAATFSGSFTDAMYSLDADLDMVADNLTIQSQQFLRNKPIVINAGLQIDNRKKKYTVNAFKMKFEKALYSAKGSVERNAKGYLTNLSVNGEDAGIQTLISLLPNKLSSVLKDYQSKGQINFSGNINGYFAKNELPGINFKFGIINGTINDSKHALGLLGVNMTGEYLNGKGHDLQNSYLHINQFTAKLNGRPIQVQYSMDNFEDPVVDTKIIADINLKDLQNFVTIPNVDSLFGEVNVNASFKGKLADLKKYSTIGNTSLDGKMTISNVMFRPAGQKYSYRNMSGSFETNGNDLEVSGFSGICGHSDFKLNGKFKNLASFLFLPNQVLNANTDLQCHFIDIDDFLVKINSSSQNGADKHFNLPAFMYFNFSLKADKLVFGRFNAANVTGNVQTSKNQVVFSNISMNTLSGNVLCNGNITDAGSGKFVVSAHAVLHQIDVKQCFYAFDNFGQSYFTDKYINGRIDATVDYKGLWNSDLTPDTKSIVCDADITVYDGEVNQFPPFIRLGKFLKVKSLDDIHFSEYTNKILISNRMVTIPKMDIKSNAVNITLAGTHTFDNVMDYKLKVNMSQLLFGEKKDYEDQFGEVEVDKNGGLNVFLTMKGPVDNYVIKYDAKSSIKNIGAGFKQESTEIKKIFKSSSPNAKPGEDLNKKTDDIELGSEDTDDDNIVKPKTHVSHEDSARKNAFKLFKNKIKNSH